jgi:predicted RNA polymerase sigma factor
MTKVHISALDQETIDNWFSYHAPEGDQAERYGQIRAAAKAFAVRLVELCPPSADRTVALRHVRDAVFNANASIACGGV